MSRYVLPCVSKLLIQTEKKEILVKMKSNQTISTHRMQDCTSNLTVTNKVGFRRESTEGRIRKIMFWFIFNAAIACVKQLCEVRFG